jgi:hypothetical protein
MGAYLFKVRQLNRHGFRDIPQDLLNLPRSSPIILVGVQVMAPLCIRRCNEYNHSKLTAAPVSGKRIDS